MGNSKSKKMIISQSEPKSDEKRERINSIKSDISDTIPDNHSNDVTLKEESIKGLEKIKEPDNASSASTIEALDDK